MDAVWTLYGRCAHALKPSGVNGYILNTFLSPRLLGCMNGSGVNGCGAAASAGELPSTQLPFPAARVSGSCLQKGARGPQRMLQYHTVHSRKYLEAHKRAHPHHACAGALLLPRASPALHHSPLLTTHPPSSPPTMLCSLKNLLISKEPTTPSDALPSSSTASILVIASRDTTDTASQAATDLGLTCLTAHSMQEALARVLQDCPAGQSIKLVVAALGKVPETALFQGRDSELIAAARTKGIPVCVFSHHACKHAGIRRLCLDAGAVAVVHKGKEVKDLLTDILSQPPTSQPNQPASTPSLPITSEYPLLKHRSQWLEQLRLKYGEAHKATQHFLATTLQLQDMIQSTPPLAALTASPAAGHVRFVTVSDTHGRHRDLSFPPGEVLLHCGDLTGNYGNDRKDLLAQLLDVAAWMHTLTQFKRIFLTAGNHDTLLDTLACPRYARALRAFVAALPAHASLLLDAGAEYRGLSIWASPTVVDRLEKEGVRYCSSGFERKEDDRKAVWAQLPENLDVLITHTPSRGGHSDPLLKEALSRLQAPPRVHVFGHCHGGAGCGTARYAGCGTKADRRGVWINAAQDLFLLREPGVGGAAWVFDLPSKD